MFSGGALSLGPESKEIDHCYCEVTCERSLNTMSKFLIAVTEDLFASYTEEQTVLDEIEAELSVFNLNSALVPPPELRRVDGLLATTLSITSAFVSNLSNCKVISRYGVGYDNIDVQAATDAGIWVCRVTNFATEEVSDHAINDPTKNTGDRR